jgi:precorrin-2 dehydrogenase/sirohydrochlorin ferrochelatase
MPLYLDLTGRMCVVVGGGPIAEGRTRLLAAHGAELRVVAPAVSAGLEEMAAEGRIADLRRRAFARDDLDGAFLVIVATNDRDLNAKIADFARECGILCNVADDPHACDVHVPAVLHRGDLAFAVSTGGASPAVSAHVRQRLEGVFGREWGDLLALLGDLRAATKQRYPQPSERAAAVRGLLDDGRVLDLLRDGQSTEAARVARSVLDLEGAV